MPNVELRAPHRANFLKKLVKTFYRIGLYEQLDKSQIIYLIISYFWKKLNIFWKFSLKFGTFWHLLAPFGTFF